MVDYRKHIYSDPKIMLGKPIVKGTRITVELLLRKIADGYTFEEVLEMYPHLKLDDILASIAYAATIMESEEVIPA
ncbi:MAG: DUF433 domain-containing protein [Lewinellaceae bacterium]|nr:DUF433 domain-containing protein [Phaeodactylibacter sp.]MCB9041323.1 DUF433 domain-containing protein [Lewinellaceae bacterium]